MSSEREKPQKASRGASSTPEETSVSSSGSGYSSGNESYVETVATIHSGMGRLTEAVESLKEQSRNHDRKLDQIGIDVHEIGKDVHAWKLTIRVVFGLIVLLGGLIGWILDLYFKYGSPHSAK
jgi:hypothetical protein